MADKSFVKIKTDEKGFKDRLNNKDLKLIEDIPLTVEEQVSITEGEIIVDYKIIENVTFEEALIFEDLEVTYGLGFVDCEFKKGIVFKNFKVKKYSENFNYENNSLYFLGCKGKNLVLNLRTNLYRGLLIQRSEFDKLKLNAIQIGNGGLKIKGSKINSLCDISVLRSEGIVFSKSEMDGMVRFESIKSDVSFIKTEFKNNLNLWNVEVPFAFISNDSIYTNRVKILACNLKSISLHNDNFQRDFTLDIEDAHNKRVQGSLEELYVADCNFSEGFNLKTIGKSPISKLTLPITTRMKGLLKIEGFQIEETKISGFSDSFNLVFSNILFKHLNILDFSNSGILNFTNAKGSDESSFFLLNSDLGRTKFNNFSFNSFDNIQIKTSNIKEISTSNIIWFRPDQLNRVAGENTNYQELREIFRQIKQSLKQEGNIIDSLSFQAWEFKSYREELLSSNNYTTGDRLIMSASWTNDFGLDWTRTAIVILIMNLVFYYTILSSVVAFPLFSIYRPMVLNFMSLNLFWEEKQLFFQLFNPVRRFSNMYPESVSDAVYFLDITQRILLAVLIFQLVKAFRKFVNK